MKTTLIYNAKIPGMPSGTSRVLFDRERILAVGGDDSVEADEAIDAEGMMLLPGCIDAHVHFREPGLTHKADIATESAAALAGGVTTYFDMPNTVPQTTSLRTWQDKMEIASRKSKANYAFFIGATNQNLDEIMKADFASVPGVKLFLGSSTGNMLVDNRNTIEELFDKVRVPIVVHAEDEGIIANSKRIVVEKYGSEPPIFTHSEIRSADACVKATSYALELLASHPDARLHVAHLTTADEVELILAAKKDGLNVTCEVSPHHLLFTTEDYARLGSRIKMNPSVKSSRHRDALRQAVKDGVIDIIATDHAPHTLEEKAGNALTAVSGAPMVQFSLPVVLDLFGPDVAVRTMCENPAKIFGVVDRGSIGVGMRPEMCLVSHCQEGIIVDDSDVISKCGWTPLKDRKLHHRVMRTFIGTPGPVIFDRAPLS